MRGEKGKCGALIGWEDGLGFAQYSLCGRPTKYKVSYNGVRSKQTECVCGIHHNSIKAWAKRLDKHGIKHGMKSELLTNPQ